MGGLVNDKFMNGFVAGVIADIPVLILDFLIKADKLDFFHYASILAFGKKDLNFAETVFAVFVQIFFAGLLGVMFTYFLITFKETYYYIKALVYGFLVWFVIYSVDVFFKIEEMVKIDFTTSLIHYVLSVLWGIGMAWALKRFVEKRG